MDPGAVVCLKCGVAAGVGQSFCGNCGAQAAPGAVVCTNCGAPTVDPGAPGAPVAGVPAGYEQKSKMMAGLLQLFLGSFGVGRFYLGDTKTAIFQILVTWLTCGLGALWPIIDGIMILTGSVKVDGKGVPLKD